MSKLKNPTKISKGLILIGTMLLVVMAIFHGSGIFYVSEAIAVSNSEIFLKDIVPVLFIHSSIHLLGLASFGVLALFLQQEVKKVLIMLSILSLIDALLAFYLGAIFPGVLIMIPTFCFCLAFFLIKKPRGFR